jgi:hypothetical protein
VLHEECSTDLSDPFTVFRKGDAMKKALLLTLVLMLGATMAFAQAGSLGIFADPAGASCNLVAGPASGLALFYVVHVFTPGATGSEYSAPKPACLTLAQWLSDSNAFPVTVGNSQIGVSVGYGTCRAAPILVQTLQYFILGPNPTCCRYPVLPHPVNGGPNVVDCADNLLVATGGQGIINSVVGQCVCDVPVQDTTWGSVKALYTE